MYSSHHTSSAAQHSVKDTKVEEQFVEKSDMASVHAAKKALRKTISEQINQSSLETIQCQSHVVTQTLLRRPEYKNARRLSIFLSIEGKEISTTAIVRDALSSGKQVFVPYIHKVQGQERSSVMDMLALNSLDDFQSLQPDNWGIPSFSTATVSERENVLGGHGLFSSGDESKNENTGREDIACDLIIVPAVAFDHELNRLGHGKGYYDTFFSKCHDLVQKGSLREMPSLVGLALDKQLLAPSETVPISEHDWRVDAILLGNGQVLEGNL